MIAVESRGSIWWLDDENERYLRTPKHEGPRPPGHWEPPQAGDPMFDLEWHPMKGWHISDEPVVVHSRGMVRAHAPESCPLLVIRQEDGHLVLAPNATMR